MRLARRPAVRADLDIWRHIAIDDADAADRIAVRLQMLVDFPLSGRARDEIAAGLRSVTVGRYVLFYVVLADRIELVRVLHGSREVAAEPFD